MKSFSGRDSARHRGHSRAASFGVERLEPRSMLAVDVVRPATETAIGLPAAADVAADAYGHVDYDHHVDAAGNAYCALPVSPPMPAGWIDPFAGASLQSPLSDTFKLLSRPSATKVIYLDYNGHTTSNTLWNGAFGPVTTPEYNVDGQAGFSDTELINIQNIYARVVEDFSPFDVDVTTEQPALEHLRKSGAGDTRWGVRVAIGGSYNDWYKKPVGGIALLRSFNWDTDTPCYVFAGEGVSGVKAIAEAITHEVGHTLGLDHDGRTTSAEDYYQGHGSGATGWAPIMGMGYSKELVQWSKGEYASANNEQDDLKIITTQNGFSYRVDDYGGKVATAFTPQVTAGASIALAGVIERNTDVDAFRFTTLGPLKATIFPADISPNLDIFAQVWDASGTVLYTSNPVDALDASFDLTLGTGTYYLAISGTGKGDPLTTGYTKYGSLGQYTVSMTIQPSVAPSLAIAATSADKPEGNSGATDFTFTVTRSGSTTKTSSATWAVAGNGSNAANGADFAGAKFPTGTVTFAAGEASKVVTVKVAGDTSIEPDEGFKVTLSSPTNATISAPTAVSVIFNDDFERVVTPPSNVRADNVWSDKVDVAWNDNSGDETGFNVYYSTNGGVDWILAGNTAANATRFRVQGLTERQPYVFGVQAVSGSNASGIVASASVTTLPKPRASTSNVGRTSFTLNWRYSGSNTDHFEVWIEARGVWRLSEDVPGDRSSAVIEFEQRNGGRLRPGEAYRVRMRAVDRAGRATSDWSEELAVRMTR